jgi:DNA polymerase-4
MIRKILHLDLDAFYCAVEELSNPTLRGKPIAVGGSPEGRGVISSCSYAARVFGVRSAMPTARAIKLCPDLIIIPPQHKKYSKVSKQVMDYLRSTTPMVLPCSIGVAPNKLLAKIANNIGKSAASQSVPPNTVTVVSPGEEAEFLAPLPVIAMWGVGPKTAERMEKHGILTIGDLARRTETELTNLFGKVGKELVKRSKGIDDRPLITHHEAKSFSHEITFSKDISSEKSLTRTLLKLSENVGKRLRSKNKSATTIKLKLRWPDFTTITRQVTYEEPIDQDMQIYSAARLLFQNVWHEGKRVRLIGVGVSGLAPPIRQLNLLDTYDNNEFRKEKQLQDVLINLRERYGTHIVFRGYEHQQRLKRNQRNYGGKYEEK